MEEENPERRKPLRSKPRPDGAFTGLPTGDELKALQERAEKKLSLLMAECPDPDEWAAKHGRTMIMFYSGRYEYRDPAITAWAKRAREVMFDDDLLTIAEDRYLTGEEWEQAKRTRENGTRHE